MKIKDAKWEMTDDYIGMKPKFQVICFDCMMAAFMDYIDDPELDMMEAFNFTIKRIINREFDMPLREVHCTRLSGISDKAHANNMHYKCCNSYGCDRVKVFGVPVDKEYYEELVKRRSGKERVQPRGQWDEEEDLRKQLLGIGYL